MKKDTVIVFTGAGISADSGVSTFRSAGGLWNNHKVDDVATPRGFKKDPQLVWDFYRSRHYELKQIEPNAAHIAVANLQKKVENLGFKFILVTQNVDRLHQAAGSQDVYELHGNLHDVKCSECEYVDDTLVHWESEAIPTCPVCGNFLRPDVVWFGEIPNETAYNIGTDAAYNC